MRRRSGIRITAVVMIGVVVCVGAVPPAAAASSVGAGGPVGERQPGRPGAELIYSGSNEFGRMHVARLELPGRAVQHQAAFTTAAGELASLTVDEANVRMFLPTGVLEVSRESDGNVTVSVSPRSGQTWTGLFDPSGQLLDPSQEGPLAGAVQGLVDGAQPLSEQVGAFLEHEGLSGPNGDNGNDRVGPLAKKKPPKPNWACVAALLLLFANTIAFVTCIGPQYAPCLVIRLVFYVGGSIVAIKYCTP